MKNRNENATQMVHLWHKILMRDDIMVCTERLKGVSLIDLNILRLLNENEMMLLRDIGNKLSISPSTLSSAIKRIEMRELIERNIYTEDLRSYSIKLTDYGKDAIREHFDLEVKVINTFLERLESKKEKEFFLNMLNKIIG